MTGYVNFDAPTRERAVSVQWERMLEDDDCPDAPDERQDGFWPSRDEDSPGWVPAERYDEAMEKATERMDAWRRGEWRYVGVVARAHVTVPIGADSFASFTVDSLGLWGLESDSGAYLDEVFGDERAQVIANLAAAGEWAAKQILP